MRDLFRKRRMWRRTPDLKDRYGRRHHRGRLARPLARLLPGPRATGSTTSACWSRVHRSAPPGATRPSLRSNYKTSRRRFYDASVRLYEGLSAELRFNLSSRSKGTSLSLTHRSRHVRDDERAEVNQLDGIDSR
jgi:hypothetical protein